MNREPVYGFFDEYHFLSNFSEEGGLQPTVEHHYQASKARADKPEDEEYVMKAPTPGQAKKRGRRIEMAKDFDQWKLYYMLQFLIDKFEEPEIQAKLLATGNRPLIEDNDWGDTFWGSVEGLGENWLGKLLEIVRRMHQMKADDS